MNKLIIILLCVSSGALLTASTKKEDKPKKIRYCMRLNNRDWYTVHQEAHQCNKCSKKKKEKEEEEARPYDNFRDPFLSTSTW